MYVDTFDNGFQKIFINAGLISFTLFWFGFNFIRNNKRKMFLIILGPYLFTSLIIQSGIVTDKSKSLRIALEELIYNKNLFNKEIQVVTNELGVENANSKIIKISLKMPKLGQGIPELEDLKRNNFAWTTKSVDEIKKTEGFTIVSEASDFKPWSLVFRE